MCRPSLQDTRDKQAEVAESVDDLHHQIENLNRKLSMVQRDLQRALEAGSYEQLAHQRETFQNATESRGGGRRSSSRNGISSCSKTNC